MNRICELFGVKYPIVQGGMVWCAGWELASAVSNAGGLGLIGSGSMHPETLRIHIEKAKQATNKPFGVNVPLMNPEADKLMQIIADEKVSVVFTSAGSPSKWTGWLKGRGIKVAHVVSNSYFARKCEDAGADAIVAEGFEAGGHNGREETTTLVLVPAIRDVTDLPLLAAGGIASGKALFAALALGADGVQVGSAFAVSSESSAHQDFKKLAVGLKEGGTQLALKKVTPARLVKNKFFELVQKAEDEGESADELRGLLGKGRAKKGMFEGNLDEGELEIGQVSALLNQIKPASEIIKEIIEEYYSLLAGFSNNSKFNF